MVLLWEGVLYVYRMCLEGWLTIPEYSLLV